MMEVQKSLEILIHEEFIKKLKEYNEFDEDTIEKLSHLAQKGDLKKSHLITTVITPSAE